MDIQFLIRVTDALMTAILCLIAASGILVVALTGQVLALLVAMCLALEGFNLARRAWRAK